MQAADTSPHLFWIYNITEEQEKIRGLRPRVDWLDLVRVWFNCAEKTVMRQAASDRWQYWLKQALKWAGLTGGERREASRERSLQRAKLMNRVQQSSHGNPLMYCTEMDSRSRRVSGEVTLKNIYLKKKWTSSLQNLKRGTPQLKEGIDNNQENLHYSVKYFMFDLISVTDVLTAFSWFDASNTF